VAVAVFLLSWFGDRLDPRGGTSTPERGHLYVNLSLPAGTPLGPTVAALKEVERALAPFDQSLPGFWSYASPGRATIIADVAPEDQNGRQLDLLKLRLRSAIPLPAAMVRVDEAYDRSGGRLGDDLEDRPYADPDGMFYRVLLKGTDADALRRAHDSMATVLARQNIGRNAVVAEWPQATTRLTLVPRPDVTPAVAGQLARALADRTTPPLPRTLPDGRRLVAGGSDAPWSPDDVPQAADLFSRMLPMATGPTTVAAAFDIRHEPVSGRLTRELGRFVLPVSITPSGPTYEALRTARANADRSLSQMALPAGVVLDRPPLAQWTFSREKLRLLGLAALLPSMMFALAAILLSSLRRALVALTPALIAVACAAPMLVAADAPMNELVLLALGAATCSITAVATIGLTRGGRIGSAYRLVRRHLIAGVVASLAGAALLGVAATGGGELGETWRAPLLAACVAFATGGASALLLPAAIESLLRPRARIAHIPDENAPVRLEVQNVTKIYAGGFRALHRISFDLEPGIIGLLGPNGAGKTTLLRIVTGLLLPARGVVRFRGIEVRPETLAGYRRHIGFLPQEFNAYAGLTAAQFLDYWALERGVASAASRAAEVERLLAIARLEVHADRKLRDFSGGMRQRIGIARAMIGDPPLLVVDEPTTGLDIEARAHFRELITALATDRIIILSTHIASDVESTASRLLLLSRGRLCWDGVPEALIARARGRVFETIAAEDEVRSLAHRYRVTTRVRLAHGVRLRGIGIADEPMPGASVEPTLEEAYLAEIAPRTGARSASFAFVYETS
jgi:ABC-type multidrug transport system ATPase subunit